MTDPVSFNKARADREGDNRLWTPRDCLQDMIDRIDRGEIDPDQLIVIWGTLRDKDDPESGARIERAFAGMTRTRIIATLAFVHHMEIEDWLE